MNFTGVLATTPTVDSVGNVYVHTRGTGNGMVYGFNGTTGATMWTYAGGSSSSTTHWQPSVTIGSDGTLYVPDATTEGAATTLYALEATQ